MQNIAAVAREQDNGTEEEEEEVFSGGEGREGHGGRGHGGHGGHEGDDRRRRRRRSRHRKWWVLCDAAKAAALDPPDLAQPDAPDFLVCSFYKIFGYPSGVGALVARRSALALLKPRYFGGGTPVGVDADEDFFRRRSGPEGLEDGTPPFAALAAIPVGFRHLSHLAVAAAAAAREETEADEDEERVGAVVDSGAVDGLGSGSLGVRIGAGAGAGVRPGMGAGTGASAGF